MTTPATSPDRLPPRESENVLFQLFRTQQALRPHMARVVEGTGVSPDEYAVLGVVGFLGPIPPTDLARRLGLPPTTVSVYAARFLERDLARRLPNPADGRSYLLEVTDQGHEVVRAIAPRIRELVERLGDASERPLRELFDALALLEDAARSIDVGGTSTNS